MLPYKKREVLPGADTGRFGHRYTDFVHTIRQAQIWS